MQTAVIQKDARKLEEITLRLMLSSVLLLIVLLIDTVPEVRETRSHVVHLLTEGLNSVWHPHFYHQTRARVRAALDVEATTPSW